MAHVDNSLRTSTLAASVLPPLQEAFCEHFKIYKAKVMRNAWGHLAPEPQTKYVGHILFTITSWGECLLIHTEFEGLDESPWLCDHMVEFISDYDDNHGNKKQGVFRWDGQFVQYENGNARFIGQVKTLVEIPQNQV